MTYRTFLVVASLVLSVLIGLVLARGGTATTPQVAAANDRLVVGLSMDTLKEPRWQVDQRLFAERVQALGAEVITLSANSSDTQQMQDVRSLISRGVDVLVIVPHDGTAMANGVRLAHEAGIPVIAYDRLIRDCDLDLYVTFDNVKVGRMQAQYLVDHLEMSRDAPARIVRIYGAKTDNNAFMFKQGQDEVILPLVEQGLIEVVHEDWADDWRADNAKRIVNAAISAHGTDIDAVLVSNDGTAGGAIQALKEEGLAGRVLVTGQDADLAACQRIAAGTQSMTVYKPVRTLAEGAAELAVQMALGRPIIARDAVDNGYKQVPSVFFEIVAVTKDNLVETVIADGFHDYDAVYQGVPEEERPPHR